MNIGYQMPPQAACMLQPLKVYPANIADNQTITFSLLSFHSFHHHPHHFHHQSH